MKLNKDETLFLRHLIDLAKASNVRGMDVFSDFLTPGETSIMKAYESLFPCRKQLIFGGFQGAERVMICFTDDDKSLTDVIFPISFIHIKVKGSKFTKTLPKHGDYLGAILGLGISRKLLGDIYIDETLAGAYLVCSESIADFIVTELRTVGRSTVQSEMIPSPEQSINRVITDQYGTVSSLRLDVVVSEVFGLSRTKVKELIDAGKVIVNSTEILNSHRPLTGQEIISARGYGKFIFYGEEGRTKKERIKIHFGIYS